MAFSKLKAYLRKAATRTFNAQIDAIGNIRDLFCRVPKLLQSRRIWT
jgi:hypothetical protein